MLSALFGGRDRLTKLAQYPDQSGFIRELATSDVHVLTVPFDTDVDPETMTADELAAIVEASATELARDDKGFSPFTYTADGAKTLPFFTSQKLAQKFVQSYVNRVRKIIPFGVLEIRGDALPSVMDAADRWLLNAGTKHETDVTTALQTLFQVLREP
ncbi:hypothetical protein Poly51_40220 [Rubripirellula tenax]|uniref:SseB protein N-terminal domain-containing protein n=1 Tax=Rubripirellula tenax TaxID=2528015 RepID=A0A5C6ETE0_9BACT|nr:SseB family protein [Rubripirellula tenax]TWU50729.1 hypothetical protein Poly51_40220 [Rubripirellula tenax]